MQGTGYIGDRRAEKPNRVHVGKAEVGTAGTSFQNPRGQDHRAEADTMEHLTSRNWGHKGNKLEPDTSPKTEMTEGEIHWLLPLPL